MILEAVQVRVLLGVLVVVAIPEKVLWWGPWAIQRSDMALIHEMDLLKVVAGRVDLLKVVAGRLEKGLWLDML